ncbi:MAG: peptidylprolyl isomerase [Armatimonadota bacterium]|nr:peptidylprolyl isomerase [bacterium]
MKRWILLIILFVGMITAYNYLDAVQTKPKRVSLPEPQPGLKTDKPATLQPGRVVELQTSKGEIDFILFERDCPKTTKQIAKLVSAKAYDGVKFGRVEKNELIQTDTAKKKAPTLGLECLSKLNNVKGAVGMARTADINSATSVFYILLEPKPSLDYEYTTFGRVIRGLDVAMSITKNDTIKHAVIRPLTPRDRKDFYAALTAAVKREVD